jgi:AcrR family transcriptional regulator
VTKTSIAGHAHRNLVSVPVSGKSVPARRRSRRGEGEQLRAEVVAAVSRLLDEWGSDEKLTMRAVAQEVGVTAASIYLHFADKTELVWAALTDKYRQLADEMGAAEAASADEGPRERLRAEVHAYCRFAIENPGHYRLMYEIRQPAVERERMGLHPARQVSGRLRRALADCAESGYPLHLPLYQATHTLWTGLHGLVSVQHSLAMDGGPDHLAGMADGLLDVLVGTEPGDGPVYPPETEVDRFIAATVVSEERP